MGVQHAILCPQNDQPARLIRRDHQRNAQLAQDSGQIRRVNTPQRLLWWRRGNRLCHAVIYNIQTGNMAAFEAVQTAKRPAAG